MPLQGMNRAAPNLVRICVDRCTANGFSGGFYHRYSTEAVPFEATVQLLNEMDRFFDQINYPQRGVQMRGFGPELPPARKEPPMARKKVNDLETQAGSQATFVVHVMYRQNATWQGNVLWAEKDQSCNFRSALELIKLMDSALEQQGKPADEPADALPERQTPTP